jgi:hypothetical protein
MRKAQQKYRTFMAAAKVKISSRAAWPDPTDEEKDTWVKMANNPEYTSQLDKEMNLPALVNLARGAQAGGEVQTPEPGNFQSTIFPALDKMNPADRDEYFASPGFEEIIGDDPRELAMAKEKAKEYKSRVLVAVIAKVESKSRDHVGFGEPKPAPAPAPKPVAPKPSAPAPVKAPAAKAPVRPMTPPAAPTSPQPKKRRA